MGVALLVSGHPIVEREFPLLGLALLLARLRDGRDELGRPPAFDGALGRLALTVELPMPRRALVGGIEDGGFKKRVTHAESSATFMRPGLKLHHSLNLAPETAPLRFAALS